MLITPNPAHHQRDRGDEDHRQRNPAGHHFEVSDQLVGRQEPELSTTF
jgi:hypothetical protein